MPQPFRKIFFDLHHNLSHPRSKTLVVDCFLWKGLRVDKGIGEVRQHVADFGSPDIRCSHIYLNLVDLLHRHTGLVPQSSVLTISLDAVQRSLILTVLLKQW